MPRNAPFDQAPLPPLDAEAVLAWYDRHARILPWRILPAERARGIAPDPYRVWLSEIMLQQTTIVAVRDYFAKFLATWPTVEALAAAPLEAVLSAWAGLGYYARARNLHACAIAVVERFGGRFPDTAEALRTLPGIGAYTSAAIASICFDERVAVVDGNVERVLARYHAIPVPVRDAKPEITAAVQAAVPNRAGDFAQAMMDLGATICAPRRTSCLVCPLQPGCLGFRSGEPLDYPVAAPKKAKPERYGHAFVMTRRDGAILLRQRGPKGLLAKMTEVPGSQWNPAAVPPEFPLETEWRNAGEVIHTFTHFRLTLTVWVAREVTEAKDGWWSAPEALAGEALPSLFRKVIVAAGVDTQPKR